jgi:hypothetical protein
MVTMPFSIRPVNMGFITVNILKIGCIPDSAAI